MARWELITSRLKGERCVAWRCGDARLAVLGGRSDGGPRRPGQDLQLPAGPQLWGVDHSNAKTEIN